MSRREIEATLHDADSATARTQPVVVEIGKTAICLRLADYGDYGSADGHGVPILLERWQGRLRLIVWADINEQEPQIIDMEGAREDRRRT
jgi:hypothetical protein